MNRLKIITAGAVLLVSAALTGCQGSNPFTRQKSPEIPESWSAGAEITFGTNKAQAEVTRSEPGCWEFLFTEPPELSGVEMKLRNGTLTASLGELSAEAGGGDFTILPGLIAEGIDGLDNSELTERDGVLTAKTTAEGFSCTVTADKSTGNILSFKCPGNKLAAYFSDVTPYTEEVGLVEE